MRFNRTTRAFAWALIAQFSIAALPQPAFGAMVSTETALAAEQRQETIDRLQALMMRDDVQEQLVHLGVDTEQARERVASLTDTELQRLQHRMDELPAGAGALEVVGIVFVVLLILELVGVTNVFENF